MFFEANIGLCESHDMNMVMYGGFFYKHEYLRQCYKRHNNVQSCCACYNIVLGEGCIHKDLTT